MGGVPVKEKRSSERTTGSVKRTVITSKTPPLAAAVKKLIYGALIDLSSASEFYKKKAEITGLLEDFVQLPRT